MTLFDHSRPYIFILRNDSTNKTVNSVVRFINLKRLFLEIVLKDTVTVKIP